MAHLKRKNGLIFLVGILLLILLVLLIFKKPDTYVVKSNFTLIPLQGQGQDVSIGYQGIVDGIGGTRIYAYAKLLVIDYDKKNIGLTTLQSSQKFANSKGKLPASVTNLFDKILITEEDIVKYPDLSTGTLYYQPIKEADFDTFMIIDGSRSNYAIDKNNVYAIPYEIDKVITSSGESLKYYQLFPSANRKFFIPFNGMWVQKDGVYIGYEKENMIQDSPLDFMKWNTNVIPLQNF